MIDTGLSAGAKQGVGARTQINVSWTLECSPWFFALDAPEQEEITMRGPVIRFFFFRLSQLFIHSLAISQVLTTCRAPWPLEYSVSQTKDWFPPSRSLS